MNTRADRYYTAIRTGRSAIRVAPGSALSRFVTGDFYAEYSSDCDLSSLDESLLAVPFVLATAPIIWCAGERAVLDRLDATLTGSLERLVGEYAAMYPGISWTGRIRVRETVPNFSRGGPDGLLFSGGLDSMHAALTTPGRKLLFTVWGADTDPTEDALWSKVKAETIRFADCFGHEPVFIRSNFRAFLRERLHTWHSQIPHWYGYVQHGPGLAGLAAPVMMLAGGRRLAMGSSYFPNSGVGWGSTPELDESVEFGDVSVVNAAKTRNRQEKIQDLVAMRREGSFDRLVLRVCLRGTKKEGVNCGVCEKCLRTATGLILEGEDPRSWGFPQAPFATLRLVRAKMHRYSLTTRTGEVINWKRLSRRAGEVSLPGEIQKHVDWLAHLNVDRQAALHQLLSGRALYSRSPRLVRKLMRKAYLAVRPSS